jgi:ABC-type branched-subunit amino acid transport system substrate-binding protein
MAIIESMMQNKSRRDFLYKTGALASATLNVPALAQVKTLRIGLTADYSAVEKDTGMGGLLGARACFSALNARGGINGVKVELVPADDQFKPDIAKLNALSHQADKSILGILQPQGTRQTASIMEAVTDMAIVGPFTGTAALRKISPSNLFWTRASYDDEIEKLIETAVTLGIERIGIVHPNDPLGKSVVAAFERSMAKRQLKPIVIATIPNSISQDVEPAAKAVVAAQSQLVILAMGGVAALFVKVLRDLGSTSTLYGLSIMASAATIKALGSLGVGIGFATIVPSPFAARHEIVRKYQADMRTLGVTEFSLPTLEGYVNARIVSEALRRAGSHVTRTSLIASLANIELLELGGLRINYGQVNRIGSNFVDVAVISANGRILS